MLADIQDFQLHDLPLAHRDDVRQLEDGHLETNFEGKVGIDPEHEDVDDSVRMYLREIGLVPLLSAKEEVELAQRMEQGKLAEITMAQIETLEAQLAEHKGDSQVAGELVSQIESLEAQLAEFTDRTFLRRDISRGDAARRHLIEANLRLVVSVAKKHMNRGMSLLDLIEEGNIGLMRAADKFDYTRGYKFSTYATWWIRQAVTRAIADQARTIRLPVHITETINNVYRASRRLSQDLGREPTSEEVAEYMEIPAAKVRQILKASRQPLSLEGPVGDGESSLGQFIPDSTTETPVELATKQVLKEQLSAVLSSLSERERRVVVLRYGLEGYQPHTLEEVGQDLGVTRERVRQIEAKALQKLRSPVRSKKLRDFLE